jgi:hypothetical protein
VATQQDDSSGQAAIAEAATTTASSSRSSGDSNDAGTSGNVSAPAEGPAEGCPCPADCSKCGSATRLLITLLCLEHGVVPPSSAVDGAKMGVFEEAAQQRGTTLQQHLKQQLLVLARCRPVPGVCGNVLCDRLEGQSAVGDVWGLVGTLCGGCRAAWYCCEGCRRAARATHREVCRMGSGVAAVP